MNKATIKLTVELKTGAVHKSVDIFIKEKDFKNEEYIRLIWKEVIKALDPYL